MRARVRQWGSYAVGLWGNPSGLRAALDSAPERLDSGSAGWKARRKVAQSSPGAWRVARNARLRGHGFLMPSDLANCQDACFNRRMRKTARPVVWEGDGAQSPSLDPIKKVTSSAPLVIADRPLLHNWF